MSKTIQTDILLVYIEPTPYIFDLIELLRINWQGNLDVLFLKENVSQAWNLTIPEQYMLLPKGFKNKLAFIIHLFVKKKYKIIHLAGWGKLILIIMAIMARLSRKLVTVESDSIYFKTKYYKTVIKKIFYPLLFRLYHLFFAGGLKQSHYIANYGVDFKYIIKMQMTVNTTAIKQYISTLNDNNHIKCRTHLGLTNQNIIFLFVGSLEKHKGIETLLQAFTQIKDNNVKLIIVGEGSYKYKVEYFMRDNKNIYYLGRLKDTALLDIYYCSDVLVLPSHFEQWGLVINEAMAVGRAVIVSDRVGCIDDLVISNQTGLIVQAEKQSDLQRAMEYMIKNPHIRQMMNENAQKLISGWTIENEAVIQCQGWSKLCNV